MEDCPLCPNCLRRCHPLQYYCANCGGNEVINPLASYMPYVRIRFNVGIFIKLWRRALYDKSLPLCLRLLFIVIAVVWVMSLMG